MKLELNLEAASVLLRCLGYGEAAVSVAEEESGEALVIDQNIKLIRGQVCEGISKEIISSAATKPKVLKKGAKR